ncbi:hypothetical protein AO373_1764 [Moraxella catarrhalis]|uniref:Uncharacterized protein n=1 Tax=Moraxella catarrhalis TaxID=480 RepID=A0AB36DM38_MORCA|nr:hypothetical protein AO379_1383 [Moraxella catarrhalis]OAV10035.1 hypothetical protein AO378_0789 [Moraxella catarrhalis]OAV17522.1 hypothetical protein AO373_1764 [Moraxella catarrhalis]OAV23089.1 hypothetical protein AO370_1747 [Moraxella catarrhalis]OAV26513.1 hypothetical protein AO371_0260 [Moraxella catarrhalis]
MIGKSMKQIYLIHHQLPDTQLNSSKNPKPYRFGVAVMSI